MLTCLCRIEGDDPDEAAELRAPSPGIAAQRYAVMRDDEAQVAYSERLAVLVSIDDGGTWFRYTVTARVERVAAREG